MSSVPTPSMLAVSHANRSLAALSGLNFLYVEMVAAMPSSKPVSR
jgi:hypothetical protein